MDRNSRQEGSSVEIFKCGIVKKRVEWGRGKKRGKSMLIQGFQSLFLSNASFWSIYVSNEASYLSSRWFSTGEEAIFLNEWQESLDNLYVFLFNEMDSRNVPHLSQILELSRAQIKINICEIWSYSEDFSKTLFILYALSLSFYFLFQWIRDIVNVEER